MQSRVVRAGYASNPDEGIKDPAHDSGKSRRAGSNRQTNARSSGIRNRRMINRPIKMADITLPKMVAAVCVPAVEDQRILLSRVCVRGDLLSRPDAE